MEIVNRKTRWNLRPLIATHLAILFAIICWAYPPTKALILRADVAIVYFLNGLLANASPFWHHACAFFNSRMGDWFYDVVMLTFLLTYIFIGKPEERKRRALQVGFLILFTIFCFLYCNRLLFKEIIHPKRPSPTSVLPDIFRLSSVVHWIRIKEWSTSCYPADHGCTIFMFILGMFHLAGRRFGALAALLSIPFLLPRMLLGAHWFSDVFLGSLPMGLFNMSLLFYSPWSFLKSESSRD